MRGEEARTRSEERAFEAFGAGRNVSYSRARDHYVMPRRYWSPLYTYRKVVGAADILDGSQLIEHDRVPPGTAADSQL